MSVAKCWRRHYCTPTLRFELHVKPALESRQFIEAYLHILPSVHTNIIDAPIVPTASSSHAVKPTTRMPPPR
jgi:hypothetical protein